jgi:nicotinate-nucleotide adenylyltransferase
MFRAMRDKLMRRVGLLGGSFNPAHPGHLHISREALKRLRLDEVWWLVSPQNPLKKKTDLAPYATRLEMARKTATDPRIHVSSLEGERGLYYTIDTLRYLLRGNRDTQFFWLMGADNLAQFHRWKDWRAIAAMLPIVVLDRAPYAYAALHGLAPQHLRRFRLHAARQFLKFNARLPAWAYLTIPRHPLSATYLRKTLGKRAFLIHNELSNL